MGSEKPAQPRDKPVGAKSRDARQANTARLAARMVEIGCAGKTVESLPDGFSKIFSRWGQDERPPAAVEQPDFQESLQVAHLAGYRPVRNGQVLGRRDEASVAGRRLEGSEGVKGKAASPKHDPSSM